MSTSGVQAVGTNSKQATSAQKQVRQQSHKSKLEAREARDFWLLISPWVIGFLFFYRRPGGGIVYFKLYRLHRNVYRPKFYWPAELYIPICGFYFLEIAGCDGILCGAIGAAGAGGLTAAGSAA
ncbi:hypothetical protein [Dictyobacter formicarum]|uniref:NarG-like domain-containing protein n=1 Tax=Dictyobacter formicarum TaxID=2778368 RepID=A0ABQ3V8D0_9CHLR|nr:hypothetical protein [Dictyobacter formicarum]GHO82099.1 hypothetical protein KSZ_01050 [Dictyobacter formicarum]